LVVNCWIRVVLSAWHVVVFKFVSDNVAFSIKEWRSVFHCRLQVDRRSTFPKENCGLAVQEKNLLLPMVWLQNKTFARTGTFNFSGTGIDFKESIPPVYVARARILNF
jgi:hypothetical protein